jgi:hypothetical protein
MSVHKKLMSARVKLQQREMKKSGHNKFAGYHYFELGDFLPHIQSIFSEIGLCGVVSFTNETATLTISDSDDNSSLMLTCPMSTAALKGCHDVQNLGAVMTYIRRYLWTTALEIVEHDVLDATSGSNTEPTPAKSAPIAKPVEKPATPSATKLKIAGDATDWAQAAVDATHVVLDLVDSADGVMEVFKNNRAVYDRLKVESPAAYDSLMQLFKTMKESLK